MLCDKNHTVEAAGQGELVATPLAVVRSAVPWLQSGLDQHSVLTHAILPRFFGFDCSHAVAVAFVAGIASAVAALELRAVSRELDLHSVATVIKRECFEIPSRWRRGWRLSTRPR